MQTIAVRLGRNVRADPALCAASTSLEAHVTLSGGDDGRPTVGADSCTDTYATRRVRPRVA